MEMSELAVLLCVSFVSILAAKILKMLDINHDVFLSFGILLGFAAGVPWFIFFAGKDGGPDVLVSMGWAILIGVIIGQVAGYFRSKGQIVPPCVPVKRSGRIRIVEAAKEAAPYLLVPLGFYLMVTRSFPSTEQLSGRYMLGFGLFAMAGIILCCRRLFQRVEICGNGLWQGKLERWEAYESFSWTEQMTDGPELRLNAISADCGTTRLIVRHEDRAAVQKLLEANLADQSSGAFSVLNLKIPRQCVRVRKAGLRGTVLNIVSVLCWPAVVLLLVYLWKRSVSLETFSGIGCLSIFITAGINFWQSEKIKVCKNGLLLGDELRAWEQYECFYWKRETEDGLELRLPLKPWTTTRSMTRLMVAPEDREAVQRLLVINLPDRSTASEEYSSRILFY